MDELASLSSEKGQKEGNMRNIISLNKEWKFTKPGNAPVIIDLPHTWNAADGQDGGNDYFRGTCIYEKCFKRPQGDVVYLEIPAAAMTAVVTVNGREVTRHAGGFSTFRVDITELLEDENVLRIEVDNSENDTVYPQKADFTFYGGLYRGVNLVTVPAVHFDLDYFGSDGIKVTPIVDLGTKTAEVTVETWQNSDQVTYILGDEKRTVPSKDGHAKTVFSIENVHLWDGQADPYLYSVTAVLESGDAVSTKFGCRKFEIDPAKGFFLNGRSYPLRGVSIHQDWKGVGNALSYDQHKENMDLVKEIGANAVRLAHYQHDQSFYDLCDENGIVVWAEIPFITQYMKNGKANTLSQMRELIAQTYNHPCIALWGLSNEITAASPVTEDLLENHRELNDLCHTMDPTRETGIANVFMLETESPILDIPDVNGYNLYFGWYLGELEQNDEFFDEFHRKYPDKPIGFTEYGADANVAYQSDRPEKGDYTESYQCVYHEHMIKLLEERPWIWGSFVWNLCDFAADGRDEGGKHGENQKGLVTFDRETKKDAFYAYKAAWNKTSPFVHICGRRYVDRPEEKTEVKVYSNQDEVSLYLDGKCLESKKGHEVFIFQVPISGEHIVEAKSGEVSDLIKIRKVEKPNPDYSFKQRSEVMNWFDKDEQKPGYFSIHDKLGELMADPEAGAVVGRLMAKASASRGDVAKATSGNANLQKMMAGMRLDSMLKQVGDTINEEQVKQLNRVLQGIKKSKT